MSQDSQHTAPRAMRRDSAAAIAAHFLEAQASAGEIDLSDDAPPNPTLILCAGYAHHFSHEFMAERAVKIVIAAQDFNIGVTDSRQAHADQRPAAPQSRLRLLNECKIISTRVGGEHPKSIGAQPEAPGNPTESRGLNQSRTAEEHGYQAALPVPHAFSLG